MFEVGGGNSSLYQAGGGSVTVHAHSYDFTIGAGTVNGHLLEGARILKQTPHGTYVAGDNRLDFRLPTDIFDTSHFLLVLGIVTAVYVHDLDIVAFAGASSIDYGSPFFSSIKATDPTGVVFLKKKIGPHWQLFSDSVISKRLTQIEALQWTPAPKTEVAFAAGIGANKPFGAVSLNMSRPRFDLQAAYIAASQQFHRITVVSPLLAEPDKENILLTIRPTSFLALREHIRITSYRNILIQLMFAVQLTKGLPPYDYRYAVKWHCLSLLI